MADTERIVETGWAGFARRVSAARAAGARVTVLTGETGAFVATVERPPAGGEEEQL